MSSPSFNQDYPGKWGWHSKMDSREVDCNTDPSCVACFEVKRIWIGGAMYSLINSRNCPMHITANESFSNNWQQHQVRHFCKIWWCTTFCKQMWEDHAGNSMLNATRWPDHIVDVNFQRNEQEHKEMSVVSDTLERNDMTHEQLLASAGEISKWDLARNCCNFLLQPSQQVFVAAIVHLCQCSGIASVNRQTATEATCLLSLFLWEVLTPPPIWNQHPSGPECAVKTYKWEQCWLLPTYFTRTQQHLACEVGRTPEGTAVMLPNSGVMLCKKESQVKSKKKRLSVMKKSRKSHKKQTFPLTFHDWKPFFLTLPDFLFYRVWCVTENQRSLRGKVKHREWARENSACSHSIQYYLYTFLDYTNADTLSDTAHWHVVGNIVSVQSRRP